MTNSIPEGYHAVQPCLTFKDAQKAIEFYKEAFGAKEQYLMPGPRGKGVMHAEVKIDWLARAYQSGDLAGAFLVIAATDDPVVQKRVHAEAAEKQILLNVADVPQWCNFILPAIARRGDLSIAISTAGKSPALAAKLRCQLEEEFGPECAVLLNILGVLRDRILANGRPHRENKALFAELVAPDLAEWIKNSQWERVRAHLQQFSGPGDLPLSLDQFKANTNCQGASS